MFQLDSVDEAILDILREDGRCSYSEIAERVHLSRVAVRERINTMKNPAAIIGLPFRRSIWPITSSADCSDR